MDVRKEDSIILIDPKKILSRTGRVRLLFIAQQPPFAFPKGRDVCRNGAKDLDFLICRFGRVCRVCVESVPSVCKRPDLNQKSPFWESKAGKENYSIKRDAERRGTKGCLFTQPSRSLIGQLLWSASFASSSIPLVYFPGNLTDQPAMHLFLSSQWRDNRVWWQRCGACDHWLTQDKGRMDIFPLLPSSLLCILLLLPSLCSSSQQILFNPLNTPLWNTIVSWLQEQQQAQAT